MSWSGWSAKSIRH
jgi:tetratricopeptide (TPR) repeat protein